MNKILLNLQKNTATNRHVYNKQEKESTDYKGPNDWDHATEFKDNVRLEPGEPRQE